jgi:hypothetical protein
MNKNEPNALKRRTRVFMYEDDGQTEADPATDFSAAGVVKVNIGAGLVNAGGTFLNDGGVKGAWIYTWTQAETNVDCNELAIRVEMAGFKITEETVDLEDPADVVAAIFANAVETGVTFLQSMRGIFAVTTGKQVDEKLDDHTNPVVFYAPDGITARITAAIVGGIKTIARNL